ncbi:MAG TPA: ABC transporter ATP-binding protein [Rhizobiaceae bacterium]|nr:ABC transporter ATP-binding protein [Rhizobiaceae bacterium]
MSSDPFGFQPADGGKDIAIRVRRVSKHYVMFERPEDRFKQMVVPRLERLVGRKPRRYFTDFAALNGVSLEVGRGETVGIIGRNGSGKSTLLQIVCGTLQPTSGSVEVNGRIAALLELGAGFNPEFTGRENVFLNAAILGVPRQEMEWRFDDIARFADIGAFINQPVKTYSSGMYVRLAFAVAINVDPDILIVDEALSVGDEAFQRKCFARIEDIRDKGGTILFVSHGAQTIVQLCNRAILMDRGENILEGRPKIVVNQYQRLLNLSGDEAEAVRNELKAMDGWGSPTAEAVAGASTGVAPENDLGTAPAETPAPAAAEREEAWFDPSLISHSRVEYETKGARITDIRITTLDGRQVNVLQSGHRYIYEYVVHFDRDVTNVGFGMLVKTVNGTELGGGATDFSPRRILKQAAAGSCYQVRFELNWALNTGTYFLNAGVTGSSDGNHAYSHRLLDALAFRIMPLEEQLATGVINFGPQPSYEETPSLYQETASMTETASSA